MENIFNKLNSINVNDKTEKKNDLTYLSWAWAWGEVKKNYPEAKYIIKRNNEGLPYIYDENLGYMVFTEVTIGELTHEMWLPVMDGANKSMKNKAYKYQQKEYKYGKFTGNYIEKTVESATMFDINKTIMRCLTKNLAMFGLGLYIYAGEDLPEEYQNEKKDEEENKIISKIMIGALNMAIENAGIKNEVVELILSQYGYKATNEIKMKDYKQIIDDLKSKKEE